MVRLDDFLSGALTIAVGVSVAIAARSFPEIPGEPGPALFPLLAAGGLIVCGVVLILARLRTTVSEAWIERPEWLARPRAVAAVVWIIAGLGLSSAFMEPVGFFPCAIALVTGLLALLRVRLWIAVVVGIAAAVIVHAIFYSGLRVALPWGLLERFAW